VREKHRMDFTEWVVETGAGSCPMADFGISGAVPSDSAITVVVS
jgi:hypothetical protein